MCFYEQYLYTCECWKWGHFRQHCAKEYRTGETCGMKLVYEATTLQDWCKICTKIDVKQRAILKERDRIKRWRVEGGRKHSIQKSEETIADLEEEIKKLEREKAERKGRVGS